MGDVVESRVEEDVVVEEELHAASDDAGAQATADDKGRKTLKRLLAGVRGVAITFDMWMSRKMEDNLSLDIQFIDHGWIEHHYHAGIISCKDSSTGEDIAPLMEPVLMEYGLFSRVVAVVKDGGGNLSTATWVLVR
eukprot:jgi/Tetstr1/449837/TSEL_036900.t1